MLKIFATISIVLHHYQDIMAANYGNAVVPFKLGYFSLSGELFFMISGYLMHGYMQKISDGLSFPDFFKKRFLRFFPLLLICTLTMTVFARIFFLQNGSHYAGVDGYSLWTILVTSLGIQEGWGIPNPGINNPTWYISYLLLCYVVFYFLTYLSKRLDFNCIYAYALMIFVGISKLNMAFNSEIPFLNGRGYTCFFWGLVLAHLFRRFRAGKTAKCLAWSALCSLASVSMITWMFSPGHWLHWLVMKDLRFILIFIYYPCLMFLSTSRPLHMPVMSRIVSSLGKISFDVYVWHAPLFLIMFVAFKAFNITYDVCTPKAMVMFAMVCYLVGTVSYWAIEKPLGKILGSSR